MSKQVKWKYGNDVGDILIAIDEAMNEIDNAMIELSGLGELVDIYAALADSMKDLEQMKDEYESYMSGEYQQQLADMAREYRRAI